jgi:hypothetical protein
MLDQKMAAICEVESLRRNSLYFQFGCPTGFCLAVGATRPAPNPIPAACLLSRQQFLFIYFPVSVLNLRLEAEGQPFALYVS